MRPFAIDRARSATSHDQHGMVRDEPALDAYGCPPSVREWIRREPKPSTGPLRSTRPPARIPQIRATSSSASATSWSRSRSPPTEPVNEPGDWLVYVRRSYKRVDDADVSDKQQEKAARAMVPRGASVEVIRDSGGHQSGASDQRDGYRHLVSRVASGSVRGIAVYDISRLARNAGLMLPLKAELERRSIPIRVATMPNSSWDGAIGRYMFGQLALAAQLQRDLDSERMVGLTRTIFENGGHRGLDPFGYRTVRDAKGGVVKPRSLEIVEAEAEVVRRVWRDTVVMPADEIVRGLKRDGIKRRTDEPWTRDAVKDILRRGRVYAGFVVYRRGAEEREGRHPAIITEAQWAAGRLGIDSRRSGRIRRSSKKRIYLLAGLIRCECGARLNGQARSSRDQEWRYYLCRRCEAPSVPAEAAEAEVLKRLAAMALPDAAVERTRAELRRRLALPARGEADERRARSEKRLNRLHEMYEWGDIDAAEYRRKAEQARADLASLPEPDKVISFDDVAARVASMPTALASATPEQAKALIALLVESVETSDRKVSGITIVPAARPFCASSTLLMAPPDGLEPPTRTLGRCRSIH